MSALGGGRAIVVVGALIQVLMIDLALGGYSSMVPDALDMGPAEQQGRHR
jgi:hypothetical protein